MTEIPEGPGSELRATRESMEVSIREVADALNLPTHVIEALESDDYDRLPPTVFTRGYLRSYARLLELAPERLLARYPEVTEELDAVTGEMPSVTVPARPSLQMLVTGAAAAVLLLIFLIWWFGDDDEPSPVPAGEPPSQVVPEPEDGNDEGPSVPAERALPDSEETADVEEPPLTPEATTTTGPQASGDEAVPVASPEAAEPVVETSEGPAVSAPAGPAESETDGDSEPVAEPVSEPAVAPVLEAAEPVVSQPVVPSRRERRITEFGDDVMTFEFTEDCWVEVKSVDGENLYSDLNRAGRTLVLTGRPPFRILLGYAPGVTLQFNGERVPLERYSRNNVANLVLGEP